MLTNEQLWEYIQNRFDRLEDNVNTKHDDLEGRVRKLEGIAKAAGVVGTMGLAFSLALLGKI